MRREGGGGEEEEEKKKMSMVELALAVGEKVTKEVEDYEDEDNDDDDDDDDDDEEYDPWCSDFECFAWQCQHRVSDCYCS